ncbi:hypothetical protein BB559_002882 [Furculomyces boomerangus]|uniref:Uncharacterized protein n=1 Tax=Furculomyces boomerangus TaxID=61424 RepID=A0A2T9YRI6_9FUNG|nr:hypothetical protein BB559_002882 [Furculomyces boomerangus]
MGHSGSKHEAKNEARALRLSWKRQVNQIYDEYRECLNSESKSCEKMVSDAYIRNKRIALLLVSFIINDALPKDFNVMEQKSEYFTESGLTDMGIYILQFNINDSIRNFDGLYSTQFGVPMDKVLIPKDKIKVYIELAQGTCFNLNSDFDYAIGFEVDLSTRKCLYTIIKRSDFLEKTSKNYFPLCGISFKGNEKNFIHGTFPSENSITIIA